MPPYNNTSAVNAPGPLAVVDSTAGVTGNSVDSELKPPGSSTPPPAPTATTAATTPTPPVNPAAPFRLNPRAKPFVPRSRAPIPVTSGTLPRFPGTPSPGVSTVTPHWQPQQMMQMASNNLNGQFIQAERRWGPQFIPWAPQPAPAARPLNPEAAVFASQTQRVPPAGSGVESTTRSRSELRD